MNIIKAALSCVFITLLVSISAYGQNDTTITKKHKATTPKDTFALFAGDGILDVTINFDLGTYLKKNLKDKSITGDLTIKLGESDSLSRDINIKTRGIFRQSYCSFPPMEISFKKSFYAYPSSGGIKKLKLVTHCDLGKGSDDYVLREYLVYKMFNVLTDTSYNVRLARINYVDSKKDKKTIKQYGFFIEPSKVLEKRINSMPLKKVTLTQKQIIPGLITRIAIFNYMIGNYDWAVPNQHNIAIFKSLDLTATQMVIAVPYDFDFTGFVNPFYAIPPDDVPIKNIRERLFTGICRTREDFKKELVRLRDRKDEMYSVINDSPYLSLRSKKDLILYLDEFFLQMERPKSMEELITIFMENCKKL